MAPTIVGGGDRAEPAHRHGGWSRRGHGSAVRRGVLECECRRHNAARGWIDQLRRDPRMRGAAGLGAWNAIEWQDRIADAAAAKAGDLAIARDRIGHVAFGVEASRSLWRRRLPADPVERLAVLAPALGRLVTTTGTSVLDDDRRSHARADARAVVVGGAARAAPRSGTHGTHRGRRRTVRRGVDGRERMPRAPRTGGHSAQVAATPRARSREP